jgi:hypothetical protein
MQSGEHSIQVYIPGRRRPISNVFFVHCLLELQHCASLTADICNLYPQRRTKSMTAMANYLQGGEVFLRPDELLPRLEDLDSPLSDFDLRVRNFFPCSNGPLSDRSGDS